MLELMLEDVRDFLVNFFEHLGDNNNNVIELNKNRELYTYMCALLLLEEFDGLVFVLYTKSHDDILKIKDLILVINDEAIAINLFEPGRLAMSPIKLSLYLKSNEEMEYKLVRVLDDIESLSNIVLEGLETNKPKPSYLLIEKFQKIIDTFIRYKNEFFLGVIGE